MISTTSGEIVLSENHEEIESRFSVVMATYHGDSPEHLLAAAESIFNQTCIPNELILVCDGPVTLSHEHVFNKIGELGNLRVLRLGSSLGPGGARHHGIVAAAHDIVAVMDADDLSVPDRFEKQLALIERAEADVVGGWIREFEHSPGDTETIRKVPEKHDDIWRHAKWRSPMNNVTAMFRKSQYLKSGGYPEMRTLEDYDLYVRMLLSGARFKNVPEILVEVRGGPEMFKRRGGWTQVPIELAMLYRMYRWKFFSLNEFLINCLIRTTMRLLPNWIRRITYISILRSSTKSGR